MPPAIPLPLPRRILLSPSTAEAFHSRADRVVRTQKSANAGDVHAGRGALTRTDSAWPFSQPDRSPGEASHRSPLELFPLLTLFHSLLHNLAPRKLSLDNRINQSYDLNIHMTWKEALTPLDTKTRILNAAEKLFGMNGFDATSLRDITAEAQVNLAAVNYHFQSKDSLIC